MHVRPFFTVAVALLVGCSPSAESGKESGAVAREEAAASFGEDEDSALDTEDTGDPGEDAAEEPEGDGDDEGMTGDSGAGQDDVDAADRPEGEGLWPEALEVWDEDGDGIWRAGEQAQLRVELYNADGHAYTELPGLRLEVDGDAVVAPETEVWAWEIGPGETASLAFWLVASPALYEAAEVQLTVSVVSQGCGPDAHPCPDPNPASIRATIEP